MDALKPDHQLRKLPPSHIVKLGHVLNTDSEWKRLMAHVRVHDAVTGDALQRRRFKQDDINIVELEAVRSGKTPFEVLIGEWGSMGKRMPTVQRLLVYLLEIESIRAASYISTDLLKREAITTENLQSYLDNLRSEGGTSIATAAGPLDSMSSIDTTEFAQDDEWLEYELGQLAINPAEEGNSDFIHSPVAPENLLPVHHVNHAYLRSITRNFAREETARFIGKGGFANVYLGITHRSGVHLAVKKLNVNPEDPDNRNAFNSEVGEAAQLKHDNIIKILAYSNDVPTEACLVYPYMENGDLEERLADARNPTLRQPMPAERRGNILLGVASALVFLHDRRKALIHRDVKSSNILLNRDWVPKLADFGLLRHASSSDTGTVNIRGTPRFMSPEAHRGSLGVKSDVFSFGVVILEVVSGLASYDHAREGRDLLTYVHGKTLAITPGSPISVDERVRELVDADAGWELSVGEQLLHFSLGKCLEGNHEKRISSMDMFQEMKTILGY